MATRYILQKVEYDPENDNGVGSYSKPIPLTVEMVKSKKDGRGIRLFPKEYREALNAVIGDLLALGHEFEGPGDGIGLLMETSRMWYSLEDYKHEVGMLPEVGDIYCHHGTWYKVTEITTVETD